MARLATDSGGRYTANTNDLTLGYARAQRDLGCVYTLGFYEATIEDTPRSVTLNVKRPGLRALHPSAYMTRSTATRRASMLQAAFQMPGLFDKGIVRAHLFPLRPTSKKRWEGLLALSFPVRLASASEGGVSTHDFGAVLARTLSSSEEVEFRFDRRISLVPTTAREASTRLVTFVDRVELKPGTYRLKAVMIDTAQSDPQATEVTIEVPQLPPGELTVLEPVLGTPAGRDVVIFAGEDSSIAESDQVGSAESFRPLLVRRLEEPTELVALNRVCRSGKRVRAASDAVVERAFRTVTGAELASVVPVELQFEGGSKLECQEIVDVVPSAELSDGDYVFEVWVSGTDIDSHATRSAARLAVATSDDGGAAASAVPLPD